MADRGYDNTKLNKNLWNEHQVKPVIGIKGNYGDQKVMPFRGFEEERKTLKYACPAERYGVGGWKDR